MPDSTDVERVLAGLTQNQCQVLYYVCQGKDFKTIGRLMGYGVDSITAQMSMVYKAFGLTRLKRNEKRFALYSVVCPIHLRRIANPATDCSTHLIDQYEPVPDDRILAVVKADEEDAIGVLGGPLATIPTEDLVLDQYRGGITPPPPPPPKPQNPLPWVLVGVLGTLLVVALAGVAFLLSGKGTTQPVAQTVASPAAPLVITAPPPSPIVITQAPIVITQAPPAVAVATATATPTLAGEIKPVGQGFTKSGVTVTLRRTILTFFDGFGFSLAIENNSGDQLILRWTNSFVHLRDDRGTIYAQDAQSQTDWGKNKQLTLKNGENIIIPSDIASYYDPAKMDYFKGTIGPQVKYLIFTIDQIAGMSNMNWQYDLQ